MKSLIRNIIKLMSEKYSLDISVYDDLFINQSIAGRISSLNLYHSESYLDFLDSDTEEHQVLFSSLNNVYSEFFRDSLTFSALESIVLPRVFRNAAERNQSEIRIWSAGCSAGQEAYSIAILADEMRENSEYKPGIRVFGTDRSEQEIKAAQTGNYHTEAFKNASYGHLCKHFNRAGDVFSVNEHIKKLVEFSVFDLLDFEYSIPPSSIFGDFDIVMACNILFYYNKGIREKLISRLCHPVIPGGFFITGPSEICMIQKRDFLVHLSDIIPVFLKS